MADRVALVHGAHTLDHRTVRERVDVLARGLQARFGVGARVCVWLPTGPEILITVLAAHKAGVVPVPIHADLPWPAVRDLLDPVGGRALITSGTLAARHAAGLAGRAVYATSTGAPFPDWRALWGGPPLAPVPPDGIALVLHTSGSDGRPKAVALCRAAVEAIVAHRAKLTGMASDSVSVMASCPSQSVGLYQSLAMLAAGGTVVLLDSYDPAGLLAALRAHRPTHLILVVEAFDRLVHHPGLVAADLASLAFASVGADRVTARVQDRFLALTGRSLAVTYGLTESSWALVNPGDRPEKRLALGLPADSEVRLVDGAGRDVGDGVVGELVVRSPRTMTAYLGDPEATARALRDGWLATGDLATRDADGYYWFAGRQKHLIVLATGDTVSPIAVERVLAAHPAVGGCLVRGVTHEGSEVPWAWVTAASEVPTEAALQAWVGDRLGAAHVPRRIVVVDHLPIGVTGKVQPAPRAP